MSKLSTDNRILVDVDSFFDTRLATIYGLDRSVFVNMDDNLYRTRNIDSFVGIDDDAFKQAYAARDVNTLMKSGLTSVSLLLECLIKNCVIDSLKYGRITDVEIYFNVYPYELTPEEKEEFRAGLLTLFPEQVEVTMVSIPVHYLTPGMISSQYGAYVVYDLNAWLVAHHEALPKNKIPDFVFYTPALFHTLPTKEELEEMKKAEFNPFELTQAQLAPMMTVCYLTPDVFCLRDAKHDAQIAKAVASNTKMEKT